MNDQEIESGAIREIEPEVRTLFAKLVERDPREAAKMLEPYPDEFVIQMLDLLNPASALKILQRFDPSRRQTILATASPETNKQWMRNQTYPERTIGRLMQPPLAVFRPQTTVAEATEQIRRLARKTIIIYGFVTDEQEKLLGVVVMRDRLLAHSSQRLEEIMLKNPFYLTPEMSLPEAMRAVLVRHYPVYPVCEKTGRLLGLLRGQMLFEAEAIEIKRATGRNGRCRKRGAPCHALAAEPEISTSLASGKFILWAPCCSRRRIFSGNNRPHHRTGGISAGAHRSGSEHGSAGSGSMLAGDDSRRFKIGQTTDTPDQGNVAWNIQRNVDRRNRRNRNVYLRNDGEKLAASDGRLGGVPCYHHQLLLQRHSWRDGALGAQEIWR